MCLLGSILLASPANAAGGIIVGPLCLDGVKVQAVPAEATAVADGNWIPNIISIDPGAAQSRIVVFAKPIPASPTLETCSQVTARMKATGIDPIVSGRIEQLKLRALVINAPTGTRVQINQGAMEVTLSKVETGQRPVAGGSIDFKGSKLWITTSRQLLSQTSEIDGEFEIEAWNRRIVGAQLLLPTGLSARTDLSPINQGNVTVRVDLKLGTGTLWKGDLAGKPSFQGPGDADFDSLRFTAADLSAARVEVVARQGGMNVLLKSVAGTASAAAIPGEKFTWSYTDPKFSIAELQATGSTVADGIALKRFDPRDVALTGKGTLASAEGAPLISGDAAARFASLRADSVVGSSSWSRPASAVLEPIFASGALNRVDLTLSGARASPVVGGSIDAQSIQAAGLGFASKQLITIPKQQVGVEWVIPILIDTPAASGSVTLTNGQQTVVLTGRLDRFYLKGRIVIPLPDIAETRLEIGKGDLRAGIGAAVSLSPFVAGTKPNFLDTSIAVTARTDLRVANKSQGEITLSAGALLLAQPVLKIGDNGTSQPASLDIKSTGAADFGYRLDTGKVELAKARLGVRDVTFSLLRPSPATIDINGDLITDPKVTLASLDIEIDRHAPVQVERASFRALSIGAALIERKSSGASGLGYSGKLSTPLTIASFDAAQVKIDDEVVIGFGSLRGFDLGISDANIDAGAGIRFENATIRLKADGVTRGIGAAPEKTVIDNASLSVAGEFRVRTGDGSINGAVGSSLDLNATGAEDALDGKGHLHIGAFSGHANSSLVIKFDCEGTGQLDVPLEYNFAMGGADIDVTMTQGKPSGSANIAPIGVVLHTKGDAVCSNKPQKVVLAPAASGWTWGICTKVFPPEAWRCKWEWRTPEVSFSYRIQLAIRFANLNAVLTNPRFFLNSDGSQHICNVGAITLIPGPIIGGYSPQIDTSLPAADRIVNAVLAASFEAPQSLLASSIVQSASWLVTAAGTGATQCIGNH